MTSVPERSDRRYNTDDPWVLCFAPGDYHQFTPSCCTHIMREFERRGFGVVWVNPLPIGMPGLTSRGGWNRIRRRMRSYLRPITRVRDRFYTMSPIALPPSLGGSSLNDALAGMQIKGLASKLGLRQPITWIENAASPFALHLIPGPKVYQLSDRYELSRYASSTTKARLALNSQRMVRDSDLVICTARTLWREILRTRSDALYLPHAIDLELFQRSASPPPDDLKPLPRPVIGYFGTLSSSNDQSVLIEAAARHPEWSIVLIGRLTGGDWSKLQQLRNVHFLGFKPLAEIPRYGSHFDVAFMNWHVDDWMHYAHPLKAREYLALGLPVVSCPIPEVIESYSNVISVARSPQEFVREVELALASSSSERSNRQRRFAAEHTWAGYVDIVLSALHA